MKIARVRTPLGLAEIGGNGHAIVYLKLLDLEEQPSASIPNELQAAVDQLNQYFSGTRKAFDLDLAPQGTDFQKKVWNALLDIPYGQTTSYLSLAKKLGDEKAIRAVAAANGKNPIWILIPCHRVIGSDGSLTGYAGGIHRKKWLLEMENPPVQQSLF